jgi:CheY-like chemotaxis protein
MRILVVDDDAICRRLIVKGLERAGYDTVEAADAGQALEVLQSDGTISLLISDLMMPGVDGFDLLDQIHNVPSLAQLPVLICSALGSQAMVSRAAHLKIAGYLLKPIDLPRLRREVGRIQQGQIRPLADLSETLSRLEVDKVDYLEMLTTLLEKLSEELPDIRRQCNSGDVRKLSTKLAGLNGAATSLGAEELSRVVSRMAQASAANATNSMSSLVPQMEKAAAQLKEAVERLCRQFEPDYVKR